MDTQTIWSIVATWRNHRVTPLLARSLAMFMDRVPAKP